ncbi:MAG: hypothetical protein J6C12_07080 [Lachnospiraceae bacterium]|nr:hypothetical protein [Roseburia sp.]MBO5113093.1 hypothetical protein [Lachnospiraceae bacterium]
MGFYDAKGYWRNDGEGFYDSKGYYRSLGEGFYDSKGYFRSAGEGFYDARGNWVSPGGTFYDGKGYCRTYGTFATSSPSSEGQGIIAFIGFVLFIPIALLWGAMIFLVEWIAAHLYIVFTGYLIVDIIISFILTKIKKHKGTKFALSFIGNYVCLLSFIYIALIYAVPYIILNGGNFGSFIEFTLVLAFGCGGIAVVQFFNYYHEKAALEFILGIAFFVMVIMILKNNMNVVDKIESLSSIYNVKVSAVFKAFFGFMF